MSDLPETLLASLEGVRGFERTTFVGVHESGEQVTSVRVNPAKVKAGLTEGIWGEMTGADGEWRGVKRVPWSSYGYYLPERPSFILDPMWHAGAYYVQEASSMFLEQALRQTVDTGRPLRVLDLCAAPGGKSTLLQSVLSADSLMVSNEVIKTRVHILEENITRWGGANTVITNNDPQDFQRLEGYFDVIVVDAPCSGSGLLRREPEAVVEWSPENVVLCWQRQQRILADCWPALRKDGILIYSTCSYSQQEDEDILDWMTGTLGAAGCRLQLRPEWNIVESSGRNGDYGYRFYPDKLMGEGFFLACVRKQEGTVFTPPRKKQAPEKPSKKDEERVLDWIQPRQPLALFYHQEMVYGLPPALVGELPVLQSALYLRRAGVPLGRLSVKEFIPEHDLALSGLIGAALPAAVLSKPQALQYLRKEDFSLESDLRGWVLAQYGGLNLGWMKVLPGRINNYYPKEWRILKHDKK